MKKYVKIRYLTILTVACLMSSGAICIAMHLPDQQEDSPSKRQKLLNVINEEDLLDHSVLVHLTDIFPKNGKMIAGGLIKGEIIPPDQAMPSRVTLHFAWNASVEKAFHTDTKIQTKKYCVLEPLKEAKDQFYGGWVQDFMLVGDYELSEKSTIIVPQKELEELKKNHKKYKGTLIPYGRGVAAEFALQLLHEKYNAWQLKNNLTKRQVDKGDWTTVVIDNHGDEHEVDTQRIFSPILENRFWGEHLSSWLGVEDIILIYLNIPFVASLRNSGNVVINIIRNGQKIGEMPTPEYSHPWGKPFEDIHTKEELERSLIIFESVKEIHLQETKKMSPQILQFIQQRHQKLVGWFNLLRKEISLRDFTRSIFIDSGVLRQLVNHREDKEQIDKICQNNWEKLYHQKLAQEFISEKMSDRTPDTDTPIFYASIAGMKHADIMVMIQALTTKLYIDERTIKIIEEHTKKGWWRDYPVTIEDLKPLLKV